MNKKINNSEVKKLYEILEISPNHKGLNKDYLSNLKAKDTHLSWKPLTI